MIQISQVTGLYYSGAVVNALGDYQLTILQGQRVVVIASVFQFITHSVCVVVDDNSVPEPMLKVAQISGLSLIHI